jgi:hypothetical protein
MTSAPILPPILRMSKLDTGFLPPPPADGAEQSMPGIAGQPPGTARRHLVNLFKSMPREAVSLVPEWVR